MANAFQDSVWILDTANTTALLHVGPNPIRIKKLKWLPNAASDTLVIKDKDGEVKISETALAGTPAGDIEIDFIADPLYMQGFCLHTMGGGTLYVYLH